jgi:hypothetical protein
MERVKIEKFSDLTEEIVRDFYEREGRIKKEAIPSATKRVLEMSPLLHPHFVLWWNTDEIPKGLQVAEFSLEGEVKLFEGSAVTAFLSMSDLIKNPEKGLPLHRHTLALQPFPGQFPGGMSLKIHS